MNMKRMENYNNFRRQPSFSIYELLKDEARRFCTETGLHGFQYISMKGNTPTERFVWTLISFGALILALTLSTLSWIYSTNYPTMIVTDSMEHPISTFLYPGVSICNLNKISKRKAYAFVKDKLKVDNATYWQDRMQVLVQMYFANYDATDSKVYRQLQHLLDENNITAENALLQVTPSCKDLLQSCSWKSIKIRCDSMFQDQRTPEGMCCTFNHFALRNRVFSGYNAERYKAYPRKLASCGQESALTVLVHMDPKDYLISEISAHGAKVLVHDTYNYPDWSAQRVLVPMRQLMYVDINPYKTYATDAVRAMSVDARGCVFTSERKLALFSNYSYENCLAECRIRILETLCNCMPFYLQNEWANWYRPLRVCNLRDIACISANKQRFLSSVPGYDSYRTKSPNHEWGTENSDCNCPPDCETRSYIVHSTYSKLAVQGPSQQLLATKPIEEYSIISIFFKDLTATRTKRDVTISWSAIFGLFGGLLGLCIGFSFTAIFDMFYTFTIRLGVNIYRKKKELTAVHNALVGKDEMHGRLNTNFNVLPLVDHPKRTKQELNTFRRQTDIWYIN